MLLNGKPLDLGRTTDADDRREAGLAHVPEDRQRMGLVIAFEEWENSILGYQHDERFDGRPSLDRAAIRDLAREQDRADSTSARRTAISRPRTSPAATSRRSCSPARSSATPTC